MTGGSWVTPEVVEAVMAHMNGDHADDCVVICRALGGRPDTIAARMTGMDAEGIELRATGPRRRAAGAHPVLRAAHGAGPGAGRGGPDVPRVRRRPRTAPAGAALGPTCPQPLGYRPCASSRAVDRVEERGHQLAGLRAGGVEVAVERRAPRPPRSTSPSARCRSGARRARPPGTVQISTSDDGSRWPASRSSTVSIGRPASSVGGVARSAAIAAVTRVEPVGAVDAARPGRGDVGAVAAVQVVEPVLERASPPPAAPPPARRRRGRR